MVALEAVAGLGRGAFVAVMGAFTLTIREINASAVAPSQRLAGRVTIHLVSRPDRHGA